MSVWMLTGTDTYNELGYEDSFEHLTLFQPLSQYVTTPAGAMGALTVTGY